MLSYHNWHGADRQGNTGQIDAEQTHDQPTFELRCSGCLDGQCEMRRVHGSKPT